MRRSLRLLELEAEHEQSRHTSEALAKLVQVLRARARVTGATRPREGEPLRRSRSLLQCRHHAEVGKAPVVKSKSESARVTTDTNSVDT